MDAGCYRERGQAHLSRFGARGANTALALALHHRSGDGCWGNARCPLPTARCPLFTARCPLSRAWSLRTPTSLRRRPRREAQRARPPAGPACVMWCCGDRTPAHRRACRCGAEGGCSQSSAAAHLLAEHSWTRRLTAADSWGVSGEYRGLSPLISLSVHPDGRASLERNARLALHGVG